MARRICPRCGKVVDGRCDCMSRSAAKPKRIQRDVRREADRAKANPWRAHYRSRKYKQACQVALSRTGGKCAVSGAQIADYRGGRWVMRECGGIHHRVPLSQGGTDDPENLVPLHVSVHNQVDAELRRRRS